MATENAGPVRLISRQSVLAPPAIVQATPSSALPANP